MKEPMTKETESNGSNSAAVGVIFGLGIGLLILGNKIGGIVGTSIDFLSDFVCLMTIIIVIKRTFNRTISFKIKMIDWALFAWWFIIEFMVIGLTNK